MLRQNFFRRLTNHVSDPLKIFVTAYTSLLSVGFSISTLIDFNQYLSENNYPAFAYIENNQIKYIAINPDYVSDFTLIYRVCLRLFLTFTPVSGVAAYCFWQSFQDDKNGFKNIYTNFIKAHPDYVCPRNSKGKKIKQIIECPISRIDSAKPVCLSFDYKNNDGTITHYQGAYDYEWLQRWLDKKPTEPLTGMNLIKDKRIISGSFKLTFNIPKKFIKRIAPPELEKPSQSKLKR